MRRGQISFAPATQISRRYLSNIIFLAVSTILAALLLLPSPYNLIPFIVIFGAAFLLLTFRYPMVGVFIYLILFFIRPQELFPNVAVFQFPYEKIVGIIVILNLILEYAVNGKKIEIYDMDKGVLAFGAAVLASLTTSIWFGGAMAAVQNFLKILAVYFFLARLINTEKQFRWVVWLYVLSVAFISISTTANYYTGHFFVAMGIQRAVGLGQEGSAYGDPNTMATTLILGIPFIYFLGRSYRNRVLKLAIILLIGIVSWTVIITGSRGGMLGSALTLILLAWKSRHKGIATVAVVLVLIAALSVMPGQYIKRLTSITDLDTQNDVTGRACVNASTPAAVTALTWPRYA